MPEIWYRFRKNVHDLLFGDRTRDHARTETHANRPLDHGEKKKTWNIYFYFLDA